ncbi:MAG: hypothetical protein V1660_00945 [archaeon]
MWQNIEKEKRAAEHLLYVSLKYTKTCDVIMNLMLRWQSMIEASIDSILEKAKKKKMISSIPVAPRAKVNVLYEAFKKEEVIVKTLDLYMFFKKINQCAHTREAEFRKNVALRVTENENTTVINMEKLKEWEGLLERFLSFVRQFIK